MGEGVPLPTKPNKKIVCLLCLPAARSPKCHLLCFLICLFGLFYLLLLFCLLCLMMRETRVRPLAAAGGAATRDEMDVVMEAFDGDAVMAQLETPFVMHPVVTLALVWAILCFRDRVVNRRIE